MSEESMMQSQQAEEHLNSLNEKLSVALIDITLKDNLVKQHAKVAEEAVSGWEKAETEAMILKQQLESATQQKIALEDRVGHLDGALKECMRQLRHVRDEQEQKIHEDVTKKSREWDKIKFELETRIVELEKQLIEAIVENGEISKSLQECSKAFTDMQEARNEAEDEAKVLQVKLDSSERKNAAFQYELDVFRKELKMRTDERDANKKTAEAAHKQHSESLKKVAKLEAECQRLRGVVRKRLPGHAALAEMKLEVESLGKECGEIKWKKSFGKGSCSPVSFSMECSNDNHQEQAQRDTEFLQKRLLAMEEENKMLQEALLKRNSELQASRVMCAKTASKLSSVEEQLESLNPGKRLQKPALEMHLEGSISGTTSNPPSLASISEDGNDVEANCAESWASALIAELDQFKKEKVAGNMGKVIGAHKVDLLDDFLEMERLASMPFTKHDQTRIEKLDGLTEKNVGESFSSLHVQEERALLEEALAKRELELQTANQVCADISRKLASVQENLTALQSKNALNESSLVKLQEKLDMILEAQAEGADLQKVLENVKCAMAAPGGTVTDSDVYIRRLPGLPTSINDFDDQQQASLCIERSLVKEEGNSLFDTKCKIDVSDPEVAVVVCRVDNLIKCIRQESRNAQKFGSSCDHQLDTCIEEFASSADQFLHGNTSITDLVTKLASFLTHLKAISIHNSDAQVLQNDANGFDNQTPDMIQSDFFNNGIAKCSLSEQNTTCSLHSSVFCDSCDISGKLSSLQAEKAALESDLKAEVSRHVALENDLTDLKSEKVNLENVLAATKERLERTRDQLSETEQTMANLQVQLASAQESRKLADYELGAMASSKFDIESQLKVTEIEMSNLCEKVDALELELQEERMRYQDAENRCQGLQEQLQRKDRVFEYSRCSLPDEERMRQEREIAAAAGKLAECQQTIMVLGRQLKALASPVDSMGFSYETEVESGKCATFSLGQELFSRNESNERQAEKGVLHSMWHRNERDRRFEQDSPWSPHGQGASWASEPENSSTGNSRQKISPWTRSGKAAHHSYKANEPGSPTHADYMEGHPTVPSSSDTEASSPTRSPMKSTPYRIPCSLAGTDDITVSLNTIEGESPRSSSSSSSSAATSEKHGSGFTRFFSRSRSSH